jgi:hypothetical protein
MVEEQKCAAQTASERIQDHACVLIRKDISMASADALKAFEDGS